MDLEQKSKKETLKDLIDGLSQDVKEQIVLEPMFSYKKQKIKLDCISKVDAVFLNKIFKEIEEDKNKKLNLNQLKKKAEQEVLEVQKQITELQLKKYITVKEFAKIYNISKTSQQNYRTRLQDPLPYHQKVEGGKITYVVNEVEQWFENQYK